MPETLIPAAELAARGKNPFPGASDDYDAARKACWPRRSSFAGT